MGCRIFAWERSLGAGAPPPAAIRGRFRIAGLGRGPGRAGQVAARMMVDPTALDAANTLA